MASAKKGVNVGKTVSELKKVLEEIQTEINYYISTIVKVPYAQFLATKSDTNNQSRENKELASPSEERYSYCSKYYYELPFRSLNIKASRDADSYTNRINSNSDDLNAVEIPFGK